MQPEDLARFEAAARKARDNLSHWMVVACHAIAEAQGVNEIPAPPREPIKRPGAGFGAKKKAAAEVPAPRTKAAPRKSRRPR